MPRPLMLGPPSWPPGPCPGIGKSGPKKRRKNSGMSSSPPIGPREAWRLLRTMVVSTLTTPGPTCSTRWVKSGRPVTSGCAGARGAAAGAGWVCAAGAGAWAQAIKGRVRASRPMACVRSRGVIGRQPPDRVERGIRAPPTAGRESARLSRAGAAAPAGHPAGAARTGRTQHHRRGPGSWH
ncbi:hypothetical protein G6F22_016676 [Rhizopus arrhizus]|nr:hypothetical protein G6F22_016676 [Rhizopus arrhizus]